MQKIHLDTDLGGDIDDLCAVGMLLRWPEDMQITGITTVADINGRRAGYVRYVLGLEGMDNFPVAAGADASRVSYRDEMALPSEERYWPEPVSPAPNDPEQAIHLLKDSIEQGATLIAIGPFTNLYLLDLQYPGILLKANLFLMGGFVYPPRPRFPVWGNEMDFNMQVDVRSAKHVLTHSNPTLIPISVTTETFLRRAYLDDLRKSGKLGQLIARQAEAFATDEQNESRYGGSYEGLPGDIINFQHDPLACAIALGWNEGVVIEEIPLIVEEKDGWLMEHVDASGRPVRVVTQVNGARFSEFWREVLTRTGSLPPVL